MKKLLVLIIITGIIAFIACSPSANEKAKIEKEIFDSIKKADSLKKVLKLDSIKKILMLNINWILLIILHLLILEIVENIRQ